jgi:hypothetical protein
MRNQNWFLQNSASLTSALTVVAYVAGISVEAISALSSSKLVAFVAASSNSTPWPSSQRCYNFIKGDEYSWNGSLIRSQDWFLQNSASLTSV